MYVCACVCGVCLCTGGCVSEYVRVFVSVSRYVCVPLGLSSRGFLCLSVCQCLWMVVYLNVCLDSLYAGMCAFECV